MNGHGICGINNPNCDENDPSCEYFEGNLSDEEKTDKAYDEWEEENRCPI